MKYLLVCPVLLIFLIYAIRSSARSPSVKVADRLFKIRKLCSDEHYYYLNHKPPENKIYADKMSREVMKEMGRLRKLSAGLSDTLAFKVPLEEYIRKWTEEKISTSLFEGDGRFISDNSLLLDFFPSRRKKQWKTLFPIYRP